MFPSSYGRLHMLVASVSGSNANNSKSRCFATVWVSGSVNMKCTEIRARNVAHLPREFKHASFLFSKFFLKMQTILRHLKIFSAIVSVDSVPELNAP